MTPYIEISHSPSRAAWGFELLDEDAVAKDLVEGKTEAVVSRKKGLLAPTVAQVEIPENELVSLTNMANSISLDHQVADELQTIYDKKLAEAGIREPEVGLGAKILDSALSVLPEFP